MRHLPLRSIRLALALAALGCAKINPTEAETEREPGFHPAEITLREVPGTSFKELIDDQLVYTDALGNDWTAPKGTWTDGASVPRLALSVTDGRFDKAFLKAAVVHDAYCQGENAEHSPEQYQSRPWQQVHRMFFEAAISGGTPITRARLMFAAVWLGGPRWKDPAHDLSLVPQDILLAEFQACKEWIEAKEPTREEIEAWMVKREGALLAQATPASP